MRAIQAFSGAVAAARNLPNRGIQPLLSVDGGERPHGWAAATRPATTAYLWTDAGRRRLRLARGTRRPDPRQRRPLPPDGAVLRQHRRPRQDVRRLAPPRPQYRRDEEGSRAGAGDQHTLIATSLLKPSPLKGRRSEANARAARDR